MTTRNDQEQKAYQEGRESAVEAIDRLSLEDLNVLLHHIDGQRESLSAQIERQEYLARKRERQRKRRANMTEEERQEYRARHREYQRKYRSRKANDKA